ncbi:MAG: hypothetical protein FWE30_03005, partial [Bacteroidales bacterium]|nr:hypothetical protein [Bacteroidales bacterium]
EPLILSIKKLFSGFSVVQNIQAQPNGNDNQTHNYCSHLAISINHLPISFFMSFSIETQI